MTNKRFNAKYAMDPDRVYSLGDLEGLEGVNGDFNVLDENGQPISSEEYELPDDFNFDSGDPIEVEEPENVDLSRALFRPLTTLSPKPRDRDLLSTPISIVPQPTRYNPNPAARPLIVENPDTGEKERLKIKEEYVHDPETWVARVKQDVAKKLFRQVEDPVAAEASRQKEELTVANLEANNHMSAVYRLMEEAQRISPETQCPMCNGNGCLHPRCLGTGHWGDPSSLANIRANVDAFNNDLDFHQSVCIGHTCYTEGTDKKALKCTYKPTVDRLLREPNAEKNIIPSTSEIRGRKKTGIAMLDKILSRREVIDEFKPTAPLLKLLGTRKDDQEPGIGTLCHYLNFDKIQTGTGTNGIDFSKGTDSSDVFSSGGDSRGGGGRDKQSFAVPVSKNDDGTYDILVSYRPSTAINKNYRNRMKGKVKRGMTFLFSAGRDAISSRNDDSNEHKKLTKHLGNLFDSVAHYFGEERSPVTGFDVVRPGERIYGDRVMQIVKNVSGNYLAPVGDTTAAAICDSGEMPAKNRKKRTFTRVRVGTGFDEQSLKNFALNGSEEVSSAIHALRNHGMRQLERIKQKALPTQPQSIQDAFNGVNFDFLEGVTPQGHGIGTPSEDIGTHWTDYAGPLETVQPRGMPERDIQPVFNSGGLLPEVDTTQPIAGFEPEKMPEVPPRTQEAIATPSRQNAVLEMIQQAAGPESVDTPEKRKRAIDGFRSEGGIDGSFRALGIPTEENKEQ
jgi:hypothetical protein